jgi:pyruvate dehydrogenase E2 component (dihydrolipoamide acetyltransferase)
MENRMASEISMPQMGLTMEAGTVLQWRKRVGDAVRRDEVLLEIETDKTAVEVTSDADGVLLAIVVPEGEEVPVGTVLGWVGQAGEVVPGASAGAAPVPRSRVSTSPPVSANALETPSDPEGRVRATPAARARARAAGLNLAAVRGTGPDGRIQARDVEAASVPPPTPFVARPTAAYRDLPVAGMRKVIAERLAQSFHGSVPVLLTTDVAMDRAHELLGQLEADFRAKTGGKVGYLPLIIKAAGMALRGHPRLNAHWLGDAIRLFEEVGIGIAVSLEGGLVVPVLRSADRMDLAEIATGIAALADKARQGSLLTAELEGGTFTISNLGAHNVGFFMPVINPPQVAILGVGRVVPKPTIQDGQVKALPVLPLSLVFDHRAIDGEPAAAFLDAIKAALEAPYRLLV